MKKRNLKPLYQNITLVLIMALYPVSYLGGTNGDATLTGAALGLAIGACLFTFLL